MSTLTRLARGRDCQVRWRPVLGYEGLYEVSDSAEVRSVARWVQAREGKRLIEGRILKQQIRNTYFSVCLCNAQKEETLGVHRIVALAFIPGTGDVVRHLDGNPLNNAVENLAWGSFNDNEADKLRHGRRPMGEAHHNSKMKDGDVRKIRELHARGFSQLKIAAALNLNRGVVGVVVRGEGWNHVEP